MCPPKSGCGGVGKGGRALDAALGKGVGLAQCAAGHRQRRNASARTQWGESPLSAPAGAEAVRILLVEDSPSDAELVEVTLQRTRSLQARVTRAQTWAEAAARLKRESFDVMLLDLALPDSNGAMTIQRARAAAPRMPIIALTGNEDEVLALQAARERLEDYVVKGLADRGQIPRVIRYSLERARAQEAFNQQRELLLRQTEEHLAGVGALQRLFAVASSRKDYLQAVVKLLREWCGCECAGVRLLKETGRLPYAASLGFSKSFLRQESKLCLTTGDCACARVLTGRRRSQDLNYSNASGSLFCNETNRWTASLGATPEQCGRIVCVNAGYQSMAQAPLRYRHKLLGTVHLADTRPGKFPPETISFIEAAALLIAEAIHRLNVEASLVESEARFRSLFERHAAVMLLVDPKTGAIVDANPAAATFYGYPQRKLRRMKIDDLHYLPAGAVRDDRMQAFRDARNSWALLHRLAGGETRMVEVHSSAVKIHGRRLLFSIIHDVTERGRLQKQLLEIGEKERQRVGQDLHDSLGGRLTGAALMAKALAQKLNALGLPEGALAQEVVECINDSIRETRAIARGLYPVELSGAGLASALAEFAAETERRSGIRCRLEADEAFYVDQPLVALHLFRFALEAVNNALRHADAHNIRISLVTAPTHLALEVRDDGRGMQAHPAGRNGLGLQTMKYRAESVGGRLSVRPGEAGGTVVSCLLPRPRSDQHASVPAP